MDDFHIEDSHAGFDGSVLYSFHQPGPGLCDNTFYWESDSADGDLEIGSLGEIAETDNHGVVWNLLALAKQTAGSTNGDCVGETEERII